jgi:hypothetical protein
MLGRLSSFIAKYGEQLIDKNALRGVDTLDVVYFPSLATFYCIRPALCVAPSVVVLRTR